MKFVVIGASAAGISAVGELRRFDKESILYLFQEMKQFIQDVFSIMIWRDKRFKTTFFY